MYMITNNQFRKFLLDFDSFIEEYKKNYCRDVETDPYYEISYEKRIRTATKELRPLVKEACKELSDNAIIMGRPPSISIEDKTTILLLKIIFKLSNRKMAYMLGVFNSFTNLNISYKSVERTYSDSSVLFAINNLFVITVKKKGLDHVDLCGDGTGYSLTITKHYRTQGSKEGYRKFVYNFAFKDLDTGLYVGYGAGLRSEKEAYENAKKMLFNFNLEINSVRLDKYYGKATVDEFGGKTVVYILPKKNSTIKGSSKWRKNIKELMKDTMTFLNQYYLRNHSESGFSADKRSTGWLITQKREDRIGTASLSIGLWHKLLLLYDI